MAQSSIYSKEVDTDALYPYLLHFKTVAEEENVTKAAARLDVSQPYLSQVIKQVEDAVGLPLFDRKGRQISLNKYGRRLFKAVNVCFRIISNAEREVANSLETDRQTVHLVSRCPLGDFPKVMNGFHFKHPDIVVSVSTIGDDRAQTDYDLEYFASHTAYQGENVIRLVEDRYCLLVSNQNPLSKRTSIALRDLAEVDFVASPRATEVAAMERILFEQAGFKPRIRCFTSSYWSLMRLVQQNAGVCIGLDRSWLAGMDEGITAIPFSDVDQARSLYLRWPRGAFLTDATMMLIEYLTDYFELNEDLSGLRGGVVKS